MGRGIMDLIFLSQFVQQYFQKVKITDNGKHFLFRCPICGDSKKNPYKRRFNLDWNDGVPGWHCFNCGRKGNFIELYSITTGISYEDAKKELYKFSKKRTVNMMNSYAKRPFLELNTKEEIKRDNFNWIKDVCYTRKNVDENSSGILEKKYIFVLNDFCNKRKIPEEYKIYICYKDKYKNRIVIPIFDKNGDIIYFQARRIPKSNIEPKYDNPVSSKELCILNEYRFDRNKNIIVNEGLIDAFMVGNQGTSCLGKEISDELIKKLISLTDKNVIVALDNDSEAYKSLNMFMENNKYAKKVLYFIYPKKYKKYDDVNKIAINHNINIYDMIIKNSISYSSAFIKLKLEKLI
jgi:DNA primase